MNSVYVAVAVDQYASTLPPPEAPKRCGCGRLHSEADWDRLQFIGRMDDGEGGVLVLRNCACGSTIAKQAWASR